VQGLSIIDDDLAIGVAADQTAREEVQAAFPPLSAASGKNGDTNNGDSNQYDCHDIQFLETVRTVAEQTRHTEWEEAQKREDWKRQCVKDALQRRRVRQETKQLERIRTQQLLEQQTRESRDLQEARAEIERWRQSQWDELTEWSQIMTEEENEQKKAETIMKQQQQKHSSLPPETAISKLAPKEEQMKDMKEAEEEERATKKAAKKKRAKQRQKERKQQELKQLQKETITQAGTAALPKKRTNKVTFMCGTCDKGFTGCGFERYDRKFCSPKCARAAEPPK
jgi:hypothetical protein